MTCSQSGSRTCVRGFTLIELLVVVAIIALLIAILLPSLSKARGQARATQCASRIAQMAKAFLLYADDYNETPPFIGRGWEDCDDWGRLHSEVWPEGSGQTLYDLAMFEDWLMPNMPEYWMLEQHGNPGWPDYARVQNGRLYDYVRFESMYRCPEFERVRDPRKSQNVFNYTRSFLARKWFHHGDPEGDPPSEYMTSGASNNWCGIAGPIMRISQIHAPSQLWMVVDERWDKHCAAPQEELQVPAQEGLLAGVAREMWMAADCCYGPWGDEFGQYHGAKRLSRLIPESIRGFFEPIQGGSLAFYDGHVEVRVDPLPDRYAPPQAFASVTVVLDWIYGLIFAQRGLAPDQIIFESLL